MHVPHNQQGKQAKQLSHNTLARKLLGIFDRVSSPRWGLQAQNHPKRGDRELRGRWLDMHDKPVSFDAPRRYHMVEPPARMRALAAYVPQAYTLGRRSSTGKR